MRERALLRAPLRLLLLLHGDRCLLSRRFTMRASVTRGCSAHIHGLPLAC